MTHIFGFERSQLLLLSEAVDDNVGADNPGRFAEWMSEAAKRCGIPLLARVHALLALGRVLSLASASGGASAATTATMLAIPAIHVAILVSAETLVRQDPRIVWFVGLAIVAEFAAAIILIERQNANFTQPKDIAARRRVAS
ncbi:MAG: hypothetical protein ACREDM_01525 [Methylocella sp.]